MSKIGVFDSGAGGLTVLKEFIKLLPQHTYIYFGDTARCPYGPKSADTIIRYSQENSDFLLQHGIELLVVACHTASAIALPHLQKRISLPVLGVIDSACEKVQVTTKTKRIGIIGTKALVNSSAYQNSVSRLIPDAMIVAKACPLFVPLVEERVRNPNIIEPIVKEYLTPLKEANIDTLILGCTHYPLLVEYIQREMGEKVTIINPAIACAEKAQSFAVTKANSSHDMHFFVSDDPKRFQDIGEPFLGIPMHNIQQISFS